MNKAIYNPTEKSYLFNCPHCNELIEVLKSQTRCCIFRHGVYKKNLKQIPPHSKKEKCDKLFEKGLIYGCGKPFKFVKGEEPYVIECDYI